VEGTEAGDVLWGMGGMRWTDGWSGGRAEKKKGEPQVLISKWRREEGRGAWRETENHGGKRGKIGPYMRAGVGFARNLSRLFEQIGPWRARLGGKAGKLWRLTLDFSRFGDLRSKR
jgi:hypothetical protein